MKKAILTFVFTGLLIFTLSAQAPQAFKYQAVVRDKAGQVLSDQSVNLKISILQSTVDGSEVYQELHSVTTSEMGLVTLEIGKGRNSTGSLSAIDWGAGSHFLKLEMDREGGSNFELMGVSQLLSVPYALYAEEAGSGRREADLDWEVTGGNVVTGHGGSYPIGNVGIGNNAPGSLLYVAKNTGEPTITVRNLGGAGGATYSMVDDLSGANWKFKATTYGGFKIRDQAYGLDVLTIEKNSAANCLYINQDGNVGIGTTTPSLKLQVDGYIRLTNVNNYGGLYPFLILDLPSSKPTGNCGINNQYDGDSKFSSYWDNGDNLFRMCASAERNDLVINSNGNVGIGTALLNTQDKLTVLHSTGWAINAKVTEEGSMAVRGETSAAAGTNYAIYGWHESIAGSAGFFLANNNEGECVGVYGRADGDNYPNSCGVVGHHYYGGIGVGAWSYTGDLIKAYAGDYPGGTLRFYVSNAGNVYADGTYNAFKKSRLPGEENVYRTFKSMQTTESWIEDIGSSELRNGEATVIIDPVFAQAVDLQVDYKVFLTPVSEEMVFLVVTGKKSDSFTVKGATPDGRPATCSFDYKIVAKDNETRSGRMEVVNILESIEVPRNE